MLMRRGMTRVITPAIFLSASILCAQDAAPATPDTDERAGDDGEDGETREVEATAA